MLPCSEKKYGERRRGRGSDTCRRFLLGGARSEPARGRLLGTGRVVARWNVKPWQPEAVTVICDRLIFRPRTALR